ncbi:N-acetylglucosamine kinase (plasmid) [Streptomyces sp. BI20]|uniref:N-acetylglucosamine kinase n=1 Tax=Streptomyces sp. BI20 TaxID=3403460 RepID=UPI003C7394F5
MALVLGIDGGGSSLRAAIADSGGGPFLATATTGAGNARSVSEALLTERLAHVIGGVLPAGRAGEVSSVVAGFAGAGAPDREHDDGRRRAERALSEALIRHGVRPARVRVLADSEIAFAGCPGNPPDGIVVLCGTGAAAARMRGRRLAAVADGCGWLVGDDGSGFWIAREGIRRALRALDGRGPATLLVRRFSETFEARKRDAVSLRFAFVDGVRALPHPIRLAAFSPVVVRAAAEGDAVAARILDGAADLLAESTAALRPVPGEPLVTGGGLLGPEGPLLDRFAARVSPWGLIAHPVPDGLPGAVALAR